MSSRTNSRRAAQTPAATNASAQPVNTDAAQVDETPDLDAAPGTVQPDATDAPPSTTESDETATDSSPEPEQTPEAEVTPATTADAPEDAAPAPSVPETAAPSVTSLLATAVSATTGQDDKIAAFAAAVRLVRAQMIAALADRADDAIIQVDTYDMRPNSASGRGPTLSILVSLLAYMLGGAGYVSYGNCHDSTAKRPIEGHVVIPVAAATLFSALYNALDNPFGPVRFAEADVKSAARTTIKATGVVGTVYQMENKQSRLRMLAVGQQILAAVGIVTAPEDVAVMRDVIDATTAEYNRVTGLAYLPNGPKYAVTPTTDYAVKQEPELVTVGAAGFTTAGDPVVATA